MSELGIRATDPEVDEEDEEGLMLKAEVKTPPATE